MKIHKFTRFETFLFKFKSKTLMDSYRIFRCKIPMLFINSLKFLVNAFFDMIDYFSPEKKPVSIEAETPNVILDQFIEDFKSQKGMVEEFHKKYPDIKIETYENRGDHYEKVPLEKAYKWDYDISEKQRTELLKIAEDKIQKASKKALKAMPKDAGNSHEQEEEWTAEKEYYTSFVEDCLTNFKKSLNPFVLLKMAKLPLRDIVITPIMRARLEKHFDKLIAELDKEIADEKKAKLFHTKQQILKQTLNGKTNFIHRYGRGPGRFSIRH